MPDYRHGLSGQARVLAIRGGDPVIARTLDFSKGASVIGEQEQKAVADALASKALLRHLGTRVVTFERSFAGQLGVRYALACSSGTAALRLALAALGIGSGDEVIVPAITFIGCVGAVVAAGARPVFCDVDDLLTLDPESVTRALTSRTKAIMAVHLYGTACALEPLRAVATAAGVPLLEDAAQACGARLNGRALGTVGALGTFSFQQGKMITSGEGGALVTDDEQLYTRALRYHDHGNQFPVLLGDRRQPIAGMPLMGENFRMSELTAALLQCQLGKLEWLVDNTNRVRRAIQSGLASERLHVLHGGDRSADSNGVALLLPTREKAVRFMYALKAEGVPCGRLYEGKPVYAAEQIMKRLTAARNGAFDCGSETPYAMGMCPRAEDLVARVVGIAIGPIYTDSDVTDIITAIGKVADALGL